MIDPELHHEAKVETSSIVVMVTQNSEHFQNKRPHRPEYCESEKNSWWLIPWCSTMKWKLKPIPFWSWGLQQNSEQFQNKGQADLRMNTWVGPQQAIS
jgi:hypothetical protein